MKHTGINNYWVDERGNILNKTTQKTLKWFFNKKNGYYSVKLSDNGKIHTLYVHRLVAKTFHTLSEFLGADVNHKDGDKSNNYYRNLEWVTRSENINHSFKLGLSNTKGSRNSGAILHESQIPIIRDSFKEGFSNAQIAGYFKVHPDTIRYVINGKAWRHV